MSWNFIYRPSDPAIWQWLLQHAWLVFRFTYKLAPCNNALSIIFAGFFNPCRSPGRLRETTSQFAQGKGLCDFSRMKSLSSQPILGLRTDGARIEQMI